MAARSRAVLVPRSRSAALISPTRTSRCVLTRDASVSYLLLQFSTPPNISARRRNPPAYGRRTHRLGAPARAVETDPDAFSFSSLNDSGASSYHSAVTHPVVAGSSSSECLEHLQHLKLSRATTFAFHVFSRPPSPPLLNEDSASSLLFHPIASVGSRSSSATGLGRSAGSGPDYQSFGSAASLSLLDFPVASSSKCFAADNWGRMIPLQSRRGFERNIPSVVGNVHFVGQASGLGTRPQSYRIRLQTCHCSVAEIRTVFNDTSSEFPTTVISPLDVTICTITSLGPTSLDASMFGTPRSLELSPEHEAHLGDRPWIGLYRI
ncbi:hypothetical protein B0H14DRAFT_3634470 [Mycena olivaceomarginata]|nr:hypothetical protein B0H14DRAFT_3634470 [Mycena olivaceomarginata]